MSVPAYPSRGTIPWDGALKEYIDYGDAQGGAGSVGPAGPQSPEGLPGAPGPTGPPGPSSGEYPLSAMGFVAMTVPIHGRLVKSPLNSFFVRTFIPAGKALTKVWLPLCTTDPTVGESSAFAIYDDAGVLIEQTAINFTFLQDPIGWKGLDLLSVIPADDEDRFVHVGFTTSSRGGGAAYTNSNDTLSTIFHGASPRRRSFFNGSVMTPPLSIDVDSDGLLTDWILVMAVS